MQTRTDVTSCTVLLAAISAGQVVDIVAPDDPCLWLAAAEVAAYSGRTDEALEDIRRAGEMTPSLRRRADCIRAELCISDGDTATAEGLAYDVMASSVAHGDRTACVRARIAVARVKVRDGRYQSALQDLPRLRREIDADEDATPEMGVFRRAICDHLEGCCRLKLGDAEGALAGAHRAIAEFVRIGAGRWEGWARGVVGLVLLDRGDLSGALREFERSETCAAALSSPVHMVLARNNAAIALLAGGRLSDAIAALRSSVGTETGTVADVHCLSLLAKAYGTMGRRTEARACAIRAAEKADELGHDELGADARIVAAWLDGEAGRLRVLRDRAEDRGTPMLVRACLVYLADLEPASRPDHARALLDVADEGAGHDELVPLVERIRARLDVAPIRIERNSITIDLSRGVPHLDDVVEAVQRQLVERAMREGGGVQRRAAAILGISPTRILALRRKLGATE